MFEEQWQPLVAQALVRSLQLSPDHLICEVPTHDGSRADLVYVNQRRVVAFELKVAEPGEVSTPLDKRAVRQLRHYAGACDAVWLVTVASPRALGLSPDLRVLVHEPLERQVLPDGVGWIVFDRLSLDVTVIVAAAERQPDPAQRRVLVDGILARLGRVVAAAKEARG